MATYPPPDAVTVPPPGPATATRPPNLLALFHGTGDGPANYAALARSLSLPGTAAVALAGPVPIAGGRGWFCSHDAEGDPLPLADARLAASAVASAASVAAVLDASPFPRHRIHLFGCGGGATLALTLVAHALRTGADGYGSCVAVGGALPAAVRAGLDGVGKAAGKHATPTLITRGERDPYLDQADVDATVDALRAAGCSDVTAFTVPGKEGALLTGAHEDEVRRCMLLWARTLKRPPPPGTVEVGD